MKDGFKKLTNAKALTIVFGIITGVLFFLTVLGITRIPVLSMVTFLIVPFTVSIWVAAIVLFVISILLFIPKRSIPRTVLASLMLIAVVCSSVNVFSNVSLAAKEGVNLDLVAAMNFSPSSLKEDCVIDSYGTFDGKDYGLSIWKPKTDTKK